MGNYKNIEREFIERSILLLSQYKEMSKDIPFKDQFNYTLLINCLLGLIVMPKEKSITFIPNDRLTSVKKLKMGLKSSYISPDIKRLRDLIIALRHSIAHFDIEVISNSEEFLVDEIVFKDSQASETKEIVRFKSNELFGFVTYYSELLLNNLKYRQ